MANDQTVNNLTVEGNISANGTVTADDVKFPNWDQGVKEWISSLDRAVKELQNGRALENRRRRKNSKSQGSFDGCIYNGTTYSEGSVITQSDGQTYICENGRWDPALTGKEPGQGQQQQQQQFDGCIYNGTTYSEGSVITQSDGQTYICENGRWDPALVKSVQKKS